MARRCLLTALFVYLVAAPPGLVAQQPNSLLLRVVWEGFRTSTLCSGYSNEMLIYRDGLLVERSTGDRGGYSMLRLTTTAAVMERLQAALAANRVGFQSGGCTLGIVLPNEFVDLTISWFGRPPRQRTFRLASVGEPEFDRCSEEGDAIFLALLAFRAGAYPSDPNQTSASLPGPAVPGCEIGTFLEASQDE